MDQKPVINYPSQFAFLLGLMGVMMIISAFLITFIGHLLMEVPYKDVIKLINEPQYVNEARLLNTMASFLIFLLPPIAWARVMNRKPFSQLGFQKSLSAKQVLLVLVITIVSIIFSGALGQLNQWIPLPHNWYVKAKQMEDNYRASMMAMANMKNGMDYLLSLLVLALAPAFFEEILFRGGFQQVFIGWTKNKWAGILVTSFFFSAVHFSYFGFLPRLALGVVLGLIFNQSRNLWLTVLLHFCNNALVVTQLYILGKQGKAVEKAMDENLPAWWGIGALIVLVYLFIQFRKESERVLLQQKKIIDSPEIMVS